MIEAAAGAYIHIVVEQRGLDLSVNVDEAGSFDTELRRKGEEHVEFVTSRGNNLKIDVIGKYKNLPPGAYRIVWLDHHPATERELELERARGQVAEAVKLRAASKYAEAAIAIESAAETRARLLGDRAETAAALQLATRIRSDKGDYEIALESGARALRIREAALGPDHPDVAVSLNDVANVYENMERSEQAIALFQRAIAICERVLEPDHPVLAIVLMNAGASYRTRRDLLKAEEAYTWALKIQQKVLGSEHRNTAVVRNNLGLVYQDRREYAAALREFEGAEATLERLFSRESPIVREAAMNAANTYMLLGNYQAAESRYARLLPMLERTLGPKHPSTAMLLYNYGSCLRFDGKLEEAERMYLKSQGIREEVLGEEHPSVGRTASVLALLAEARGDIADAVKGQRRAAEITERQLQLNLAIGSEREKLAYLTQLPSDTSQMVSTAIRSGDAASAELAATVVLQRKGRVEEAMAQTIGALRSRLNTEDARLLDEWNSRTGELARLVLNGPGTGTPSAHRQKIRAVEEERGRLEDILSRHSGGLFANSKKTTLDAVQAAIPRDAALLEFVVYLPVDPHATIDARQFGPARYAAFVLRPSGPPRWTDLGGATEVERLVARVRSAMSDPKRSDARQLSQALHRALMEPLRPWLDGASHLILSPDGALHLIPFGALQEAGGRYLVERHTLSYVTSGRELPKLVAAAPRPPQAPPVIVADPWFGEPQESGGTRPARRSITTGKDLSEVYFAPLPGTAAEAHQIQSLFPQARLITGRQATKAALTSVSAPRILHLATHGFFLEDQAAGHIENPLLRAGLALAGANRAGGVLTALEASGLNLRGTGLVTLSACDTGLGEVKNGEGVYGFRRALHVAGAETLVMSLWAVSDQATREWMTGYYTGLRDGLGRSEALRRAQLRMLRRVGRQHPFYWAGFIPSGAWAPLH
jgi:CHAT domain-containing protein